MLHAALHQVEEALALLRCERLEKLAHRAGVRALERAALGDSFIEEAIKLGLVRVRLR
jgi:hypothetical protein